MRAVDRVFAITTPWELGNSDYFLRRAVSVAKNRDERNVGKSLKEFFASLVTHLEEKYPDRRGALEVLRKEVEVGW